MKLNRASAREEFKKGGIGMRILHTATARVILTVGLGLALIVATHPVQSAAQSTSPAQPDQVMPAVGSAAPDFTLPSQEGNKISLHDYKGKWVVLYFYPKDMTQGCTIEAHNFQRDLAQYDTKGVVILGVSADTIDSHKEFCTKESLTFKILADPNHDVIAKYGSLNPPYTMKDGTVLTMAQRNTFLINPQGTIVNVYTKVNPNTHSEALLTDLTAQQGMK
jgi:peroxiredoxin Q/BCP